MTVGTEQAVIAAAIERASDTRAIISGPDALAQTGELFSSQFGRRPALLVADETTAGVALAPVRQRLEATGVTIDGELVFSTDPVLKPLVERSHEIAQALEGSLAIPVAIGSGTINDLVKYGAALAKRSYLAVSTAASMDGYAASGAALIGDGFKQTYPCPAPQAIIADLELMRSAPPAMTASGYADLVGKITAGADWILADALGIEPIAGDIWEMVQPWVRALLPAAPKVPEHDPETIELLVNGLLMTGLAMQATGSSRPASGSEHQFSHYWEMQGLSFGGVPVSHGFKVGLGSIAVSALYELMLAVEPAQFERAATAKWTKFGAIEQSIKRWKDDPRVIERAIIESHAKHPANSVRHERIHRLQNEWPSLQDRLRTQLLPAGELSALLRSAGCPVTPEELGLTRKRLKATYAAARQIRRRYTVLDTVTELGVFDAFVDTLFRPGGFWSTRSSS